MRLKEGMKNFMLNGVSMQINVDDYIINALKEDITSEDVTTNAIMRKAVLGKADLICKEDGILAGLDVFIRVFTILDSASSFDSRYKDGDMIKKGELIGVITGDIRALLSGERTALNYLQRMSGIATFTRSLADELKGSKTKLLDTRKTTPNMRPFEKYAVKVGGGYNHRYNLSDGILIKDNHIGAAGSITTAIALAEEYAPFVRKIEIEVENLEMLQEALAAGADIIMLDNMDNETMKLAVKITAGQAETECSGNVTKERLKEIAEIGVDYVSCGALTHSAPILDISLKNLVPIL
jgi:nicotinate-nucleotide pyrophosphorylase (carboxylating)